MFPDFRSRGFGIEQTQIHYPDRVGRLILVMALALYWAVSTGMWDAAENPSLAEKTPESLLQNPQSWMVGGAGECVVNAQSCLRRPVSSPLLSAPWPFRETDKNTSGVAFSYCARRHASSTRRGSGRGHAC